MEAELQLRQALVLQRSEQLSAAIRQFRAVLPRMEATGTRDRLAYVLLPGGQALSVSGAYSEAEAWLTRGIQLGKETGSAFLVCAGLSVLCWMSNHIGRWDDVLEYSAEGRILAERHDLRWWFTQFLSHEGEIRLYRGEFKQATHLFEQLSTHADQNAMYSALTQRYLAYGAFMAGDIGQAVQYMRERAIGSTNIISTDQAFDLLGIAEWWILLKAIDVPVSHHEAVLKEAVANSIVFWQRRGYHSYLPYAWRVQAMLDWHANRFEHAFVAVQRGLSIAQQIGNVPEQARCLFWRAKIAFATTSVDQGLSDLDAAARVFAALGAWPEHRRTQALAQTPHNRSIVL
jgi:tetratricopeptide (TPR) repeat protein